MKQPHIVVGTTVDIDVREVKCGICVCCIALFDTGQNCCDKNGEWMLLLLHPTVTLHRSGPGSRRVQHSQQ